MHGSCLCKNITYRIDGNIIGINYCHCNSCQKASGTAFATSAAVNRKDFYLLCGEQYITAYQSSKGKKRYFCKNCGSPLYSHYQGTTMFYIRLGTLDDDPIKRPEIHIYTKEKPCWHEINDDITKLDKDEGLEF